MTMEDLAYAHLSFPPNAPASRRETAMMSAAKRQIASTRAFIRMYDAVVAGINSQDDDIDVNTLANFIEMLDNSTEGLARIVYADGGDTGGRHAIAD
ncbi:hypothetical protein [Castellaniella sp. S9]|uniref:hypothetical protein n=1 Tax=Castellaniella sp. S9 TaxID=2993652 RepID=UPI0022B2B78A|nr:hypothetical protein [Castellaniella sp. S9]